MIDRSQNSDCGLRIGRPPRVTGTPPHTSTFNIRHSTFDIQSESCHRSFTLIELLVAISILAILASAVVFASFEATEAARRAATRTKINVIHMLLMERWESYQGRRAPRIDTSAMSGLGPAMDRLRAIRLLMLIEMPERWDEVALARAPVDERPAFQTSLYHAYARRKTTMVTPQYENAECLYMIIMLATGDGEARSFFKESDIGDVDGDGAPEFLDSWGIPIRFIRWPAGFQSEIQPYVFEDPNNAGTYITAPDDAMATDHDPLDVFRVDPIPWISTPNYSGPPRAFRLMPLIYSFGADGIGDINAARVVDLTNLVTINPFARDSEDRFSGQYWDRDDDGEDNSIDNIHNHLQDVK